MAKNKVICVGEALVDRLINDTCRESMDYLGGAPANVASALSKLDISTAFIGCLGDDKYGAEFIKLFQELKINSNLVQIDNRFSTRVIKVSRDKAGDRSFSGFEASEGRYFSDEMLDSAKIKNKILELKKLLAESKYIVTGTNLLAADKSSKALIYILNQVEFFDIKVVIDINWRDIFWDSSVFVKDLKRVDQINKIKTFLRYGDVLKLALEEAMLFFETNDPSIISRSLPNQPDVIITNGANPTVWFINKISGSTKVNQKIQVVDTTGAGDAFLAGLISKFSDSSLNMVESQIQNYVRFASACGNLTCLREGAIESQPRSNDVYKFLETLGS